MRYSHASKPKTTPSGVKTNAFFLAAYVTLTCVVKKKSINRSPIPQCYLEPFFWREGLFGFLLARLRYSHSHAYRIRGALKLSIVLVISTSRVHPCFAAQLVAPCNNDKTDPYLPKHRKVTKVLPVTIREFQKDVPDIWMTLGSGQHNHKQGKTTIEGISIQLGGRGKQKHTTPSVVGEKENSSCKEREGTSKHAEL